VKLVHLVGFIVKKRFFRISQRFVR